MSSYVYNMSTYRLQMSTNVYKNIFIVCPQIQIYEKQIQAIVDEFGEELSWKNLYLVK